MGCVSYMARPVRSFGTSLSSNLLVGPRMAMALPVELHDSFVDGAVEVIGTGKI